MRARPPGLDLLPSLPDQEPQDCNGHGHSTNFPASRFVGEKGAVVTLHSERDPWKEAEILVQQARLDQERPVVALGLGLGYHLVRLAEHLPAEQLLAVVEKRRDIFNAALARVDLSLLFSRPETVLVVHDDPRIVLQHLHSQLFGKNGSRGPNLWGHPPSLRAENTFYQAVIEGLRRSSPCLSRRHRGLHKEHLRVLILNTDYFLIPEVTRAFKHLGHQCLLNLIDKRREQGSDIIRHILRQVADFSPDLVFTVNHLGFDREGILVEMFHRFRVPSVSWYVDSPHLILSLYQGPTSDLVHIFVWDRDYIKDVKALGFEKVDELPLATDPVIFRPRPPGETNGWQAPVSFVGNSMVRAVQEKLSRLPTELAFQELFSQLLEIYQQKPYQRLATVLSEAGLEHHPLLRPFTIKQWTDLEAALIWAATRDYRQARLRALGFANPVIYGDSGWRELLSGSFRLRPEVNYYDQVPLVYAGSEINFNATSLQMKTAVNQRVFDVPAAGGFLLTDFKTQLAELFRLGEEMICYQDIEEIPALVRFYQRHPEQRRRVVENGRQRVLREHTYVHRIQTMLAYLRKNW